MKVGIVGIGKLGTYHCNALTQLSEAELVGVFDIDGEKSRQTAEQFKCQAFDSLSNLIDQVEIVGVVVPTIQHLEVARTALTANKAVFIEKPIASSQEEGEEIVRLAAQKNLPIQVGHIERFNPAILSLEHHSIAPMFIESHRLAPFDPRGTDVAVVLDLMIHDIDIILSLVTSDVTHIDASGVAVVSEEIDIANARIRFRNNCVANVTASRVSQRKMRKMRLFQKDAYISIDFLQKLTEVFRVVDEDNQAPQTVVLGKIENGKKKRHIIYEQPPVPVLDAIQAEWQSFIEAIKNGTRPIVNGEDGLKALRFAEEITRVIAQNTPWEGKI